MSCICVLEPPQPEIFASIKYIFRECEIKTRIESVGKDVEVCDPTSKTVCVPKTRYEPEEYLDDECTTTSEQVCKTNYVRNLNNSPLIFSILRKRRQ